MILLRTLGTLAIEQDDRPVKLGNLKTALCLVYLRHQADRRVPRSELIDVLWGANSPQARHSLSQSLYTIRRALRSLHIETSNEHVLLRADRICYDLEDLERAVQGGCYDIAADIFQGGFLEKLSSHSCPVALERWIDQVACKAAASAALAFKKLIRHAELTGNWRDVKHWAGRALDLDEFDGEAHAHRIRAVAAESGIEAASRLSKDVRAHFVAELGGIGSADLRRTCERYADCDATGLEAPSPRESPIRGRIEEFQTLTESWFKAEAGRHQLILMSGPAGIGKTRLSTHFLKWAAIRGSRTLTAKASQADTHIPYAIMVQLLRSGIRKRDVTRLPDPWSRWCAALLPEYSEKADFAGELPNPGQRELFETVGRLLESMCDSAPLTVLLDDVDLCDLPSAWLLHFLFQRFASEKFVLVLASRKPPDEMPEQVRAMISALSDSCLNSLALAPVDYPSAVQIAQDILSQSKTDVPAAAWTEIIEYAQGVPYFVVEAAASFAADHITTFSGFERAGNYGILSTVRLLSTHATAVLRALAVLGFRAPQTLVRTTAQCAAPEFSDSLARLCSKRLLKVRGQYLEFDHDLIREAVLADLPEAEGRSLHRRAAMAIANTASAHSGHLAIHFTAAGILDHAYAAAMSAAEDAGRLHSPEDVEFYLRLAISRAPSTTDRSVARAALAEHFCDLGVLHEAQCILTSSPDVWTHLPTETAHLLRVYGALTDAACSAADVLSHFDSVWPSRGNRIATSASIRLLRVAIGIAYQAGSPLVRDVMLRLVEEAALGTSPEEAKLLACLARTWAVFEGGPKALELADRGVSIARAAGDKAAIAVSFLARGTVNMLMGKLIQAEEDYRVCDELVREPGLLATAEMLTVNRSVLLIETCRADEASSTLEGTLAFHVPIEQLFVRGNMALAALEMDDESRLLRRIKELRNVNAGLQVAWVNLFADCMEAYLFRRRKESEATRNLVARLMAEERAHGSPVLGPEPSYAQALIAEYLATESEDQALVYVDRVAEFHSKRNVLGEIRVRLMRAEILMRRNADAGKRELKELIARCRAGGALTLLSHCERLARATDL